MDTKSLYRWAGVGPTNTDNFPLLEYKAPRGFFSRSKALLPDRYRFGETATLLGEYRKTHQATATELTDLARYYTPFILTSDMVYSALADALRLEPENQEALKLMAQVLTRRNQLGEADEVLKRLASAGAAERELFELSYPVALAFAQRRSASFINLPDYSTALAIKERLAELEPSRSIHYFHLGEIYQRLDRFSQAADAFQIALKLRASENNTETPDLPALIHLIGKCYLEGEDFTSAEFWFSRLAREYPQEPLGQEMLRLVIIEKLISEGGRIDAERLRKALPE
jgi:tetratricopeptide (TPR) repeat protein